MSPVNLTSRIDQGLETLERLCDKIADLPDAARQALEADVQDLRAVLENLQERAGVEEDLQKFRQVEAALRENRDELELHVEERTADLQSAHADLRREVEERRKANEALGESEARLWALVSASAQALYRLSPDWSEMRKLQVGNFLVDTDAPNRNRLQEYIHPDDQARVQAAIENAIQTGTVFDLEHRVLRADGTSGWTVSRAVPVRNAQGEIVEWFGAASDITDRKHAEEALAQAYAELEARVKERTARLANTNQRLEVEIEKRKEAEAALAEELRVSQKTREQHQLAMEASQLGIFDYDILAGTHEWDSRSRELWGIGPDEVVTHDTFQAGIHPEDRAALQAAQAQAFDPSGPGKYAIEYRVVHRGAGQERWIAATGQVYFDQGRPFRLVGTVEDITGRKRMEQDLADSERRYRELIQYAPTAMYEIDFRTGRFIQVNDSMVDLTGYSRDELMRMSAFELLDEESQARFKERVRRWLAGEKPGEDVEYRVKAKDGQTIYAVLSAKFTRDEQGRPLGAMVVGHDITERKLAEAALRANAEALQAAAVRDAFRVRLADTLRSLADPLMILDESSRLLGEYLGADRVACLELEPDGQHLRVNCEYHNDQMADAVGRYAIESFGPRFKREIAAARTVTVADTAANSDFTGEEQAAFAVFNIRACVIVPLAREGRAVGFLGVHQADPRTWTAEEVALIEETAERTWRAVEQLRLEAERQKAAQEREIHHRLAEQREMERQSYARDIHDGPIQTLSSLAFNLQYIREVYPEPALKVELDQMSLNIKTAVQELRGVINELRPPSVIRFGLAKAIQVHVEALRERYPQVQWTFKLDNDGQILPEQTCLAMFRIYQEAVNNIIRHSEAARAWVTYRVFKNHVMLEIRDNGKGFEAEQDMVRLTSHQHFGLAGINERVEAIGGTLEIETKPGKGTKVRVKVKRV